MAAGVIERREPRYHSSVRWRDAEIKLEQVKKILRAEKMAGMVLGDLWPVSAAHI